MIRPALVAAPESEPVTLIEAKEHAKIEISDDDDKILAMISGARERIEGIVHRALAPQTWSATCDAWPDLIDGDKFRRVPLAMRPITAISSVTVDGVALSASYYRLSGSDLVVTSNATEPNGDFGSEIVITYTCGYTAENLLASLKLAVLMMVAHYYEARGATSPQGIYHQLIPEGVAALIQTHIVQEL